jgi:hypothetical protein
MGENLRMMVVLLILMIMVFLFLNTVYAGITSCILQSTFAEN